MEMFDKYRDKRILWRYSAGNPPDIISLDHGTKFPVYITEPDTPPEDGHGDVDELSDSLGKTHITEESTGGAAGGAAAGNARTWDTSSQVVYKKLSKDEKIAQEAGIRFSLAEIVGLPMDEFNDMLAKEELTEDQLNLCRDIRRRGKNKVAAQNCRKRKIDQIDELQAKIAEEKYREEALKEARAKSIAEYQEVADRLSAMIHKKLVERGLDPNKYTADMGEDGNVRFVLKEEAVNDMMPKSVEELTKRSTRPEYF